MCRRKHRLQRRFAPTIEMRAGLVEYKDARIAVEGARKPDPLPLAARQRSRRADYRLVAVSLR